MKTKWFNFFILSATILILTEPATARMPLAAVAPVSLTACINKVNLRGEIRWHLQAPAKNILRFELQKSNDGQNFSYVTSVAVLSNKDAANYFAEDRNPSGGNNYYRLKTIYKDGLERFSPVSAAALPEILPTILPAAAEDLLAVWLPGNARVQAASITDIFGKMIIKDAAILNQQNQAGINVHRLAPGLYNISLKMQGDKELHLKFTKK